MGKVEISYFFWTNCRYLNFVFAEILIEYISMFYVTFFLILYFDWFKQYLFFSINTYICYKHIILSIWIGKQAVIAYIYPLQYFDC